MGVGSVEEDNGDGRREGRSMGCAKRLGGAKVGGGVIYHHARRSGMRGASVIGGLRPDVARDMPRGGERERYRAVEKDLPLALSTALWEDVSRSLK